MTRDYGSLRPHRRFWVALALIALFGLLQASATLDWSLRTDEPFTANTVHRDWPAMWATFKTDNIFPLHYVLLWGWVRVFGESEIALRIPSLIFYGAMIVVVGRTAQRAAGSRAGWIAALLLAVSTNVGQVQAAIARPYALLGLLIALTTHVTFGVLQVFAPPSLTAPARRWHLLLIGLHTLGLLTHPLYAFVLGALTLAAVWVSRRAFIELVFDGAMAGLLFLLVESPFLSHTFHLPTTTWMPVPGLKELAEGWLNLWGEQKTLLIGGYVCALGLWRWRRLRPILTSPSISVSLTILVITGLMPFAVSQIKPIYLETRAPVIFLPSACVLAGILIRQLDHRLLSLGLLAGLSAASTLSAYRVWSEPERIPAQSSLRIVAARVECGDVLVLGSLSLSETEYYFRRFAAPACLQLETFPYDTAQHPGWLDGPGRLAQPELLQSEASQTAERLAQTATRVWLFYDSQFYPQIGDVITSELCQHLVLSETLALRGSFFDSVLLYTPSR